MDGTLTSENFPVWFQGNIEAQIAIYVLKGARICDRCEGSGEYDWDTTAGYQDSNNNHGMTWWYNLQVPPAQILTMDQRIAATFDNDEDENLSYRDLYENWKIPKDICWHCNGWGVTVGASGPAGGSWRNPPSHLIADPLDRGLT